MADANSRTGEEILGKTYPLSAQEKAIFGKFFDIVGVDKIDVDSIFNNGKNLNVGSDTYIIDRIEHDNIVEIAKATYLDKISYIKPSERADMVETVFKHLRTYSQLEKLPFMMDNGNVLVIKNENYDAILPDYRYGQGAGAGGGVVSDSSISRDARDPMTDAALVDAVRSLKGSGVKIDKFKGNPVPTNTPSVSIDMPAHQVG